MGRVKIYDDVFSYFHTIVGYGLWILPILGIEFVFVSLAGTILFTLYEVREHTNTFYDLVEFWVGAIMGLTTALLLGNVFKFT